MISGYVKAVFICISVASTTPSFTSGDNVTGKCFPLTEDRTTNVLDSAILEDLNKVEERFFISNDAESKLVHGLLILDASNREYSASTKPTK
jgi:hypothetical protein